MVKRNLKPFPPVVDHHMLGISPFIMDQLIYEREGRRRKWRRRRGRSTVYAFEMHTLYMYCIYLTEYQGFDMFHVACDTGRSRVE